MRIKKVTRTIYDCPTGLTDSDIKAYEPIGYKLKKSWTYPHKNGGMRTAIKFIEK